MNYGDRKILVTVPLPDTIVLIIDIKNEHLTNSDVKGRCKAGNRHPAVTSDHTKCCNYLQNFLASYGRSARYEEICCKILKIVVNDIPQMPRRAAGFAGCLFCCPRRLPENWEFIVEDYSDLITEHDLARQMGLSVWALRSWRRKNYGPEAIKMGKRVYYRRAQISAFISALEPIS